MLIVYLEQQQQHRLQPLYQSPVDLWSESSLPEADAFSAELPGIKQKIVDSFRHAIDYQLKVLAERSLLYSPEQEHDNPAISSALNYVFSFWSKESL